MINIPEKGDVVNEPSVFKGMGEEGALFIIGVVLGQLLHLTCKRAQTEILVFLRGERDQRLLIGGELFFRLDRLFLRLDGGLFRLIRTALGLLHRIILLFRLRLRRIPLLEAHFVVAADFVLYSFKLGKHSGSPFLFFCPLYHEWSGQCNRKFDGGKELRRFLILNIQILSFVQRYPVT